MEAFWLVWNPQGRAPTFQHPTFESARDEAQRLARLNPGARFVVLEAVGFMVKTDTQWMPLGDRRQVDDDGIPF